FLERMEVVSLDGSIERRFHPVVAWDERRIYRTHGCSACLLRARLFGQAPSPCRSPRVISVGVGEQCAYSSVAFRSCRGITQPAEGQGEVGPIGGHALQQVFGKPRIALALREKAKLAPQAGVASRLEVRLKRGEGLDGRGQRGLFASRLLLQNGQQCLRPA